MTTDVPVKEVMRRTGKTYSALREMRKRDIGRWTKVGFRFCLHADDVAALERKRYKGNPIV